MEGRVSDKGLVWYLTRGTEAATLYSTDAFACSSWVHLHYCSLNEF